jgi:hypothetical protein
MTVVRRNTLPDARHHAETDFHPAMIVSADDGRDVHGNAASDSPGRIDHVARSTFVTIGQSPNK